MNIQLLNKIAKVGLNQLGDAYHIGEDIADPDGIMVRSAVMHEMEFGANLKAIARAGAGVNNIPLDRCSQQGIVVFNTPGANANGVKELAVCALLLAARNVIGGIEWAKSLAGTADVAKQVEKGKSKFAGTELQGKTLGVIGLGAIGGLIANTAIALGMNVIGCDPFLSVEGAWNLDHNVHRAATYDEIFEKSDYITLHVPATKDTKNMICTENIAKMKDGAKIINLSRADLVNAAELKVALADGKISAYVTDFPTEDILDGVNVVAIPHLGASTEESEDNCAVMAVKEVMDYLENGNIVNSVNYPNCDMGVCQTAGRITILHRNIPNSLGRFTAAIAADNVNIDGLMNKSRGEYAYTMLDFDQHPSDQVVEHLKQVEGVLRVRVIK